MRAAERRHGARCCACLCLHQVLFENTHSGVCHSDAHIHDGYFNLGGGQKMPHPFPPPFSLGHEMEGVAIRVGPDVPASEAATIVGKRFAVFPWLGCEQPTCVHCGAGNGHNCLSRESVRFVDGRSLLGGYSSHVVVPDPKFLVNVYGHLVGCLFFLLLPVPNPTVCACACAPPAFGIHPVAGPEAAYPPPVVLASCHVCAAAPLQLVSCVWVCLVLTRPSPNAVTHARGFRDGIDKGLGCIYMCAGLTAFAALKKVGAAPHGASDILVIGLGGVGMQAVFLANAMFGGWPMVMVRAMWRVAPPPRAILRAACGVVHVCVRACARV